MDIFRRPTSALVVAALGFVSPGRPAAAPAIALPIGAETCLEKAARLDKAAGSDLLVTVDWLAKHVDDPAVGILQIEPTRDRYDAGHIPGARFLSLDDITWDGPKGWGVELRPVDELEAAFERVGIGDATHVVIASSRAIPAARAWLTLDYLGHGDHAAVLDGGVQAWKAAGHALTRAAPAERRGSLTLHPREDIVVSADWVHERLSDSRYALIDARPDDEYTGADNGMGGMVHPGHIPGAAQLYWERLLEAPDRPTYRDRETLRTLFVAAGATSSKTVVTYCMVGMRASVTYFVARLLGYDARFYDGSWHDWGARTDLPYVSGNERGEPPRR